MHVQDLKRWHWVLISLFVGLLLSWVWSSVEWDENLPTIGQHDFETGLTGSRQRIGALINIVVMPPMDGKYKVVAEHIRPTQTAGKGDAMPVAFIADTPYKAGVWRGESEEYPTVMAYLQHAMKDNPELSAKYAWYREKWAIFALWTGASVLLIGGVWPSVVSLMVGAGLGFHGEEKGPDYDLDRFKSEAEKKAGGAKVPTAAELQHLRELEEEMERKLAAQRAGLPIPEDEPAQAPAAVKKLDGGTLENLAPQKPGEEHEYSGEFYPVDHGVKKKS
jgi:hypothetical protein